MIGRKISDQESKILALPVRFGGLGVANPVECADREYNSSVMVTKSLTELLYSQEKDLKNYDREKQNEVVKSLKTAREAHLLRQYNDISQQLTGLTTPRHMELNREKGAGSWLTCLPLSSVGYCPLPIPAGHKPFIQRTTPDIGDLFQPLEDVIHETFLLNW